MTQPASKRLVTEAALADAVATKVNSSTYTAGLAGKQDVSTLGASVVALLQSRDVLNILDYGVVTGTAASQTAAIKTALDANPGKAFHFPPGDYRLDTGLAITASNSLHLADGARLYAGATMTTLIDYDNGLTVSNYAQDKFLAGQGTIDAALKANKALAIGSVIRFTLGEGLTIVDPINRGIWLKSAGAEVIGRNIRLHNTGTTNVTDNIAIEADMGDCQISDVVTRDFTVGIWDKGGNVWNDVHPWIGTTAQLTARYPTSVAFILASNSVLTRPYADTYRYGWRTAASSGFSRVRVTDARHYVNTGNLTSGIATANPGALFDLTDGSQVQVTGGRLAGGATAYAFVQGSSIRFNARNFIDEVPGSITGLLEYRRGVTMGTFSFAGSLFGSTAGSATLTTNSCSVEVRDGTAEYKFILVGTLPAGWAGKMRIGIPTAGWPTGATGVSNGVGTISFLTGPDINVMLGAGASTPGAQVVLLEKIAAGATTEPDTTALAGQSVQVWGQITCPFTYPS